MLCFQVTNSCSMWWRVIQGQPGKLVVGRLTRRFRRVSFTVSTSIPSSTRCCSLSNPWASYGLSFRAIAPAQLSPLKLRATIRESLCYPLNHCYHSCSALRHANWSSSEELHHETSHRNSKPVSHSVLENPSPGTFLDDTHNPLIAGRSALANTVTFFETGYLIYDTSALLYSLCLQHNRDSTSVCLPALPMTPSPSSTTSHLSHLLTFKLISLQGVERRLSNRGVLSCECEQSAFACWTKKSV